MAVALLRSVPNTAPSGTINITRGNLSCPGEPVQLSATISGFDFEIDDLGLTHVDVAFRELDFEWTITAPANEPQTHTATLDTPAALTSRLRLHGAEPGFLPLDPDGGTYGVTLVVRHPKMRTPLTISDTFTTTPVTTSFPGASSVAYSATLNSTGLPAGTTVYDDWDACRAAFKTLHAAGPAALYIERGSVLTFSATIIDTSESYYITAYGTGARPILNCTALEAGNSPHTATTCFVGNLDCRGSWDAATETGSQNNCWRIQSFDNHNAAFYNCSFDGFEASIVQINPDASTPTAPTIYLVENCTSADHRDYAAYWTSKGHTGRLYLIANRFWDNDTKASGGWHGNINNHGHRMQNCNAIYIYLCELFNRGGWTFADITTGVPSSQGMLRLNQAPSSYANIYLGYCKVQGSINYDMQDDSFTLYPNNLVIEGCWVSGGLLLAKAGAEIRSSVLRSITIRADEHAAATKDSENFFSPIRILYCGLMDFSTGSSAAGINVESPFGNLTTIGNVQYAPNKDTPVASHTFVSQGTFVANPGNEEKLMNYEPIPVSLNETIASGESFSAITLPATGVDGNAFSEALVSASPNHYIIVEAGSLPWQTNARGMNDLKNAAGSRVEIDVSIASGQATVTNVTGLNGHPTATSFTATDAILFLDRRDNPTARFGDDLPSEMTSIYAPDSSRYGVSRPVRDIYGNLRTGFSDGPAIAA